MKKLRAPASNNDLDRIVDLALNCVKDQHVLRQLQAGVPWRKAFGTEGGGICGDLTWHGTSKGLVFESLVSGVVPHTAIPFKWIMARARQYQ